MGHWGSLPDELIIRVLLSLIDDPRPILVFAQTSKRHNAIATDDSVWLPITAYIFKQFGIPSILVDKDVLRQNRSRMLTHVQPHQTVFHQLYIRLLGPYSWLMGWWVVKGSSAPTLCRAYVRFSPEAADGCICSMVGHPVISAFDTYQPPEILHATLRYTYSSTRKDGFYMVNLVDEPFRISVYGHNTARIEYPQYPPVHHEWLFEVFPSGEEEEKPTSKRVHRASRWNVPSSCTLTPPIDTFPWALIHPNPHSGRLLNSSTKFNDAPFPSPSSVSVIPGLRFDASTQSPIVPRSRWSLVHRGLNPSIPFSATPIDSPASFPLKTDDILTSGIYMTPGAIGPRFVFLRIRSLTQQDFVNSWPWEGHFGSSSRGEEQLDPYATSMDWTDPDVHLGPFSAVRCTVLRTRVPRLTSKDHIHPGARIIEVTKIAGGGVPFGQRSVVAFLQDPLVPPDLLAEMEEQLPASHHDLPQEHSLPWPISRGAMVDPTAPPTASSILQTQFSPEKGIDIPAVGRIALEGFIQPSWIDVVVHVESKDQFTVFWQDLDNVEVYTKMNDV